MAILFGCQPDPPKPPPLQTEQLQGLINQINKDPDASVAAKRVSDGALTRIQGQKEVDDFAAGK